MLRGFSTAAAGMIAQQRRMEMLSNNLANANTAGYKADQSSLRAFPELLLQRMEQADVSMSKPAKFTQQQLVGQLHTGVYLQETASKLMQGDLQATGSDTDIAIWSQNMPAHASIFFTIEHPDGTPRYTRNGNFALDAQGFLTTNNGYYVLDENNNRIQIASGSFQLQTDGTILEGNQINARLGIAYADNANGLIRDGSGLYRPSEGQQLQNAADNQNAAYQINQGYLERSNVDAAQTMSDMTAAYRAFEANQKVIQAYDSSLQKAVNEIGRIN